MSGTRFVVHLNQGQEDDRQNPIFSGGLPGHFIEKRQKIKLWPIQKWAQKRNFIQFGRTV